MVSIFLGSPMKVKLRRVNEARHHSPVRGPDPTIVLIKKRELRRWLTNAGIPTGSPGPRDTLA